MSTSPDSGTTLAAEENMSRAGYALRVLTAIRSQLPQRSSAEPVVVVGPSPTMSTAIGGAALSAAIGLAEVLHRPVRGREGIKDLRELAVATLAWVETYLDCYAIEAYSFDADWDHVPRTTR